MSSLPLLAAVAMLSGCGGGPELIEVVGTVLLNGSAPPGPGTVFLAPIEDLAGTGARPAVADFDVDGSFTVSAFSNQTGLKPGRYRVTIQIWKERPEGYLKPGINLVPRNYKFDDLVVESGQGRQEVTYDVLTKKT